MPLEDLLRLMEAFSRPPEVLARRDVRGLTVSTIVSPDMGPETAILDENRTIIVERYANRAAALEGHYRWCVEAELLEEVTDVGYGNSVSPRTYRLQRMKGG